MSNIFLQAICITCNSSTDEKGNPLLHCEHMWNGKLRRKKVPYHAMHKKCIPDWASLQKPVKWRCKQWFCLVMRSENDKRPAQSFPTFSLDMNEAFFQLKTFLKGPFMRELSRNGFPIPISMEYKVKGKERCAPCCFEPTTYECEHT